MVRHTLHGGGGDTHREADLLTKDACRCDNVGHITEKARSQAVSAGGELPDEQRCSGHAMQRPQGIWLRLTWQHALIMNTVDELTSTK